MRDSPKPRRPLPTPKASTDSSAQILPAASMVTIPASHFYSTKSSTPPPLPSRPKSIGSTHTNYKEPPPYSQIYKSSEKSPFREPELVADEPMDDDAIPDLVPQTDQDASSQGWNNVWDPSDNNWHTSKSVWGGPDDPWSSYNSNLASKKVEIDGRDEEEEQEWWNQTVRENHTRPGPGILPSALAEKLHKPKHTLFSVGVTPPDMRPSKSSIPDPGELQRSPSLPIPPTEDDVRTAVPHPNAYYCRIHNGWVLLIWKSSSVIPPLAKSFLDNPRNPLPDQSRRKRTASCIGDGDKSFGHANRTHHFHCYPKAVDAHKLNPPFRRNEWETLEKVKQKRRKMTVDMIDFDKGKIDVPLEAEEEEGDLLDLYVCCQCSFYCVVSDVIPGVISPKHVDEFTREKTAHPPLGKNGPAAVLSGWETILTIIENKLWKGENRPLPVTRNTFQNKLGWNPIVREVFSTLGFEMKPMPNSQNPVDISLYPPPTDISTPQGRLNRARFLRAWVEISAWIVDYQRHYAQALSGYNSHKIWVKIESAVEGYQAAIGAHSSQLPREQLPTILHSYRPIDEAWTVLGLTPASYSWEHLSFAYLAQCRCDPTNTPQYFTHFFNIVKAMEDLGEAPPSELQTLIIEERSRYRYTHHDLGLAMKRLGFGKDGQLGVELEDDIPDEFIIDAWKDAIRRAWNDLHEGSLLQREANDAFRILADHRGSATLKKVLEEGQKNTMNPDRAYSTLEIPKNTEDGMILTVFDLRVQEQPSQCEKMREALSVIAEVRDSDRIRRFLKTGIDEGEITLPVSQNLPRGLNQLGNTCYLNSLLQYFYTIKDLREAVAPMARLDEKSPDDKLTDDDIKRHRVGGRLVTRKEISRSKKFISQLANLFWDLEHSDSAAVTPTIQLAKLALTTSKDEEDDEVDRGGTDSSNDTDATLVEDGNTRSPIQSSASVLGKRLRDTERGGSAMDVDNATPERDQEGYVIVSKPASSGDSGPSRDKDGDVEMTDSSSSQAKKTPKPPLPARKTSESVMMFGKQHDVSECMDNCMFQIETALLKFNSQDEKTSVVKRLFYGKMRQRLTVPPDDKKSLPSIHDREDIFSHLPVKVAEDGFDIYDGLSSYFDDSVDYGGKEARMENSLVELPPLLQVQLQRVQFDRESFRAWKSQAYVKFEETIYMDRFLDSADPEKKSRSKVIQSKLNYCRERLRLLTQGTHAPFAGPLGTAMKFLSRQESVALPEVDEDLIAELNTEVGEVQTEAEKLREGISKLKKNLEDIWEGNTETAYELTSVFIHRGSSAAWGHYFFYSRHLPEQPDSWFKYNDSEVTAVSKDVIFADTTGSTANPYLLVFTKKGSGIVQTVNRFTPLDSESA